MRLMLGFQGDYRTDSSYLAVMARCRRQSSILGRAILHDRRGRGVNG
jgi:hypothetical protein